MLHLSWLLKPFLKRGLSHIGWNLSLSTWNFVAGTGRLSASPFHDFVESLKIGTRFPVGKKLGHLQSGQLFRNCRRHKLVDACTVFFALLLNCLFQRAWQPQRISARFRHFPILSIARRGVITWMPNRSGTVG